MHDPNCRCFHHMFFWVPAVASAWTTLGFFISLLARRPFLGFATEDYFMSALILFLVMHTMKFCPCGNMRMGGMKGQSDM